MDNALRAEFRAFKAEIEDRVKRLEKAVQEDSVDPDTIGAENAKPTLQTKPEAKKV